MQINDEYDEDNDDKKQHFPTSFGILKYLYQKNRAFWGSAVLVVVRFIVFWICFEARFYIKWAVFMFKWQIRVIFSH